MINPRDQPYYGGGGGGEDTAGLYEHGWSAFFILPRIHRCKDSRGFQYRKSFQNLRGEESERITKILGAGAILS